MMETWFRNSSAADLTLKLFKLFNEDNTYVRLCLSYGDVLWPVLFRIIGVTQDLTPAYTGSMTVYVRVSTTAVQTCFLLSFE